jgi:hypothetical protein
MNQPHTPHANPTDSAGYETRDVGSRGIVLMGTILMAVAACVMFLLVWLLSRLDKQAERADPPVSPLAIDAPLPPGPRLEVTLRHTDVNDAAREQLNRYGWVDKPEGVVHIPIERAMQILAQRGLPEPSGPVQPPPDTTNTK